MSNCKIKIIVASITLCFLASSVCAKIPSNTKHWYTSVFAGTSIASSGDTFNPAINLASEPEYRTNLALSLATGLTINEKLRADIEFGYQRLPMDDIKNAIPGITVNVMDSKTTVASLLINGYYDFNTGSKWHPYLGLGIGYAYVRTTIKPAPSIVTPSGTLTKKTLNFGTFAYQGIAGLAYQASNHIKLAINYKYFRTATGSNKADTNLGTEPNETDQNIVNHLVTLGISYYFDT